MFTGPVQSAERSVSVAWTPSENTRLLQIGAYLGQTPEEVQKSAVFLLSYLVGFLPAGTDPQTLPVSYTNGATYTSKWDQADSSVLHTVSTRFVIDDTDATRLSFWLLDFLLGLSGH